VTPRALLLVALMACGVGCFSAPPSGVITCNNSCPISGYYCASDGYCWANGEYPNPSSTGGATSAGVETTGTGGTESSGTGATGTAGEASGASTTGGVKASTGGSSTGKASTGGSSTGGTKTSTGSTGV